MSTLFNNVYFRSNKMFTIKEALHRDRIVSNYQRESIGEMDDSGQEEVIRRIDYQLEIIASEMCELDEIIQTTSDDDEDESARERIYTCLQEIGYYTLARQAVFTCIDKHEPIPVTDEKQKQYIEELEAKNSSLVHELHKIKEIVNQ